MITVTGLFTYPVKSCRGIALSAAAVTTRGLPYDREWMVVDENGVFLTQRTLPRMALVSTALIDDSLILSAPGAEAPLMIPLVRNHMATRQVRVWRDDCAALDEGNEAASWFSTLLERPCRLVRFAPMQRRLSAHEWTGGLDAENQFSDGYPILIISEESLEELNRRLDEPLPMNRFRPNVVLRGLGAHGEDHVRTLTLGGLELRLVKPCDRCRITTTDQHTGEVGKEPLRTLATYRREATLGGVTFGMNAIVTQGFGQELTVGAKLQTLPDLP